MKWSDLRLRLRAFAFWNRTEKELEEEVQFHLEMQIRKLVASGMAPSQARHQARRQFGAIDSVKEECRDRRGLNLLVTLFQDAKYALRSFARAPLFTLGVVFTIGMALGLNTAVFTIFDAYVLRPLAIRDPHSLYRFTWFNRGGQGHLFKQAEFDDFRKHNTAFSGTIAAEVFYARVDGHSTFGQAVSGNFFDMLGVSSRAGRILVPDDADPTTAQPVMVLSDMAWRNKFGADPSIVGKRLLVRGQRLEVVGIAAPEFNGVGDVPMDYWLPITLASRLSFEPDHFDIFGRPRMDLTLDQVRARLEQWATQATAGMPEAERCSGVLLEPRATMLTLNSEITMAVLPIAVAFGLVLLIACANIANMMIVRGMARQREIGIRLSLGAARGRLIRQLLTESAMLAIPGALAGFIISRAAIGLGLRTLFATMPAEFAEFLTLVPLEPDLRVFAFILAAALISAVLFGLAPALQCTRSSVIQVARGDFDNQHRPMRLRNALVVSQVTVSVLLLICAALLLRGTGRLNRIEGRLNTNGVIDIEVEDTFRSAVLQRLASNRLVSEMAAVGGSPLDGALPNLSVIPDGNSSAVPVWYRPASPEYFSLLSVPILRGRNFTPAEAEAASPIAIVSKATADLLWPGKDALGQSFRIVPDSHGQLPPGTLRHTTARVVGVAENVISGWVGHGLDKTCIYFPTAARASGNALLVRVHGNAEAARRELDATISAIHPGAITQIHNMQQAAAMQIYPFRVAYCIAGAIGAVGFLLTLSGIYGLLAYVITQRTKEIGIRMALGATTSAVTGLILRQSMLRAVGGIALGTLCAIAVSALFAAVVPMVNTFDAVSYLAVILMVLFACAAAAYIPSRRAARIDPISTLRYE